MQDSYGRDIEYLRISLTDRCNLRCRYCMPEHGIRQLPRETMLTFEELRRLAGIFSSLGIRRIRLTGGEPLLRPQLPKLIAALCAVDGIEQVHLTTNGILFAPMAKDLKDAGLHGATFSLDTLRPDRFQHLTRRDALSSALDGLEAAYSLGFSPIKINCIPLAGINEDELTDIAALAADAPFDVRFIELMPMGCAKACRGVPAAQVYARLCARFGQGTALPRSIGEGPATYVAFPAFSGRIGFISPMTHSFCTRCSRIRLTAQGALRLCLHRGAETDLRALLRSGKDDAALAAVIRQAVQLKPPCHLFGQEPPFADAGPDMHSIGG